MVRVKSPDVKTSFKISIKSFFFNRIVSLSEDIPIVKNNIIRKGNLISECSVIKYRKKQR